MGKKKESPTEKQNIICPNPLCGKTFTNTIKVENMKSNTVYEACPYCLTEITVEKLASMGKRKVLKEKGKTKKEKPKDVQTVPVAEEKKCKHYFGYLSKRSAKKEIPDECIVCERIVQCMLKNISG